MRNHFAQIKKSRHGSEMGVLTEQLEKSGFKVPMLLRLLLLTHGFFHVSDCTEHAT
jgi:hypothetical protein